MEKIIIPEEENCSLERFYNDLKSNPNNFSNWFPKIEKCGIPCPESVIIPVPIDIMQSFFMERTGDEEKIRTFIRETIIPSIPKEFGNRIFLKNGCFSDKFIFKNCIPTIDEQSLFNSITNINMDSLCLDTGGNTELVIRKLIGEKDNNFKETIYEGMRLRPEIRVFYDFDNRKALYAVNYWDWSYCYESIARNPQDKEAYEKAYPTIEHIFQAQKDYVLDLVDEKMKKIDMKGIWSIDLMYAHNIYWLIDMAVGYRSAYWDPKRIKL